MISKMYTWFELKIFNFCVSLGEEVEVLSRMSIIIDLSKYECQISSHIWQSLEMFCKQSLSHMRCIKSCFLLLIVLFINKLITFSCLPRVSLIRCCYFFTQHHMTRALFAIINSNICISLETWLWTFKIKSFIQNAQINHFIPKREKNQTFELKSCLGSWNKKLGVLFHEF